MAGAESLPLCYTLPDVKLFLPTRVPFSYLASFSAALLVIELVEGTPVLLAITAQAFLLVAGVAFNLCGGLAYASGAFVFFSAVLSLGLGVVLKALLGEPLQSNLIAPQKTLLVYLAGMGSVLIAALVSTRLRRARGLLEGIDLSRQVVSTGLGCLLIATVTPLLLPEALLGTFLQFNSAFVSVAILLMVYQTTRASGGKRTFHPVALASWAYVTTYYGILHFSKQGLFAPSVAWAIAAIAGGYRTSLSRLLVLGAVVAVAVSLLTPYSQLARNYAGRDDERQQAIELLTHPLETRAMYQEQSKINYELGVDYHWFDEPQGLLDRLTMVPIDDALIASTDSLRPGSPYALWTYVINIVPRFLFPDKPLFRWGNLYAHDIGVLADNDESTGISFTPFADGYHTAQWLGVTLYLGVMMCVMFLVCDSVGGSIQRSPWGLMYLLYFAHAAPEGMLEQTMYSISNLTAALVGAALIARYVAPVIGNFLFVERPTAAPGDLQPYNPYST